MFDGVITLVLGLMVWAGWPWSAVWFLGLAVGISLLMRGLSYVMIALALRRLRGIIDQPQVQGAA